MKAKGKLLLLILNAALTVALMAKIIIDYRSSLSILFLVGLSILLFQEIKWVINAYRDIRTKKNELLTD